jgi:hypothetical protein
VPFVDKLDEIGFGILGTASRNENGAFVSSVAWTGSNFDGTATASTCAGWDSSTGFGSVGSTTSTLYWGELAGDGSLGCGSNARLYCFEAPGVAPARPAWPEPAALVFVRTGGGSGDFDGIVFADITCQDQAAEFHLPGAESFRAWLSDSDTNAKDRLTIDGPWYRTDGVRVAASLAALTDSNLDSSIRLIPNGGFISLPDRVWTGTLGNGNKASLHCLDWFTFDSEEQGFFGLTDETGNSWTAAAPSQEWPDACNQAGRFYCFGNVIVTFWDGFEGGDTLRWSARAGVAP